MPFKDQRSDEEKDSDSALADSIGKIATYEHQLLTLIGNDLAQRFGYAIRGVEACRRYMVDRYGWLPSVVRSLSLEDLHFLLEELADADIAVLPSPSFGSGLPLKSTTADHPKLGTREMILNNAKKNAASKRPRKKLTTEQIRAKRKAEPLQL